jgi:hypothetical protein
MAATLAEDKRMTMKPMNRFPAVRARAAALGACLWLVALGGCVYYPAAPYPGTPYPAPAVNMPSTYDRAYDAALGALSDQGLGIVRQDRASGTIVGSRGPVTVTASVQPQPDGTTRVAFQAQGDQGADAGITQRVVSAYNARMGR